MKKNVSGQFLFFDLTSAVSGSPVTGQAAGVSGRAALDDGAQAALVGSISEVGGGQYRANLFAADTNGNNNGYLFTASGCVPRSFTVVTTGGTSGTVYLASGSIHRQVFASGVLAAEIPDRVLSRDFTALSGVVASGLSGRCLVNAARKLTNAWDLSAASGFLSVYQEDDTTVAMQQAFTSVSGASPVTGLDTR